MSLNFLAGLGKLHPLVVHFPIALLIVFAIWDTIERKKAHTWTGLILLATGALSAIASVLFGFILEDGGGYEHQLIEDHEHFGLALAVSSTILSLVYGYRLIKKLPKVSYFYLPMNLTILICLSMAGHYGGELTRGRGYLSLQDFKPAEVLQVDSNSRPLDVKTALVYQDLVQPILKKRCVQCHNPGNAKGGLDMSSFNALVKRGGKDGLVVAPGSADGSMIIQRALLPDTHRLRMPTGGAQTFTSNELAVIKWWLNSGASDTARLAHASPPAEVNAALQAMIPPTDLLSPIRSIKVPLVNAHTMAGIRKSGIQVRLLQANEPWLEARIPAGFDNPDAIKFLMPIKDQIAVLNLSGSRLSATQLELLNQFKHLVSLNLSKTNCNDQVLKALATGLPKYLQVLNLSQTTVSSTSLPLLTSLRQIQRLYLWQTSIPDSLQAKLGLEQIVVAPEVTYIPFDSSVLKPRF